MLQRIFKATSSLIISLTIVSSILFLGWDTSTFAIDLPNPFESGSLEESPENSNQQSIAPSTKEQGSTSETSKDSLDQNNTNQYPDLGDDQVFPFVAGLDSYESISK